MTSVQYIHILTDGSHKKMIWKFIVKGDKKKVVQRLFFVLQKKSTSLITISLGRLAVLACEMYPCLVYYVLIVTYRNSKWPKEFWTWWNGKCIVLFIVKPLASHRKYDSINFKNHSIANVNCQTYSEKVIQI